MATFLHRLGAAAFRHRVPVVVVWVLLLALAGAGAATLAGKTVNTFEIPGQESTTALRLIGEEFGDDADGASAQVVLQVPEGQRITDPQNAAGVAAAVAGLAALPGVVGATNPLDPAAPVVSPDLRAAYSTVTYAVAPPEVTEAQRAALFAAVDDARAGGLTAEVTGDATQGVSQIGGPAEVVGVVVALLVLALTYGSLVAAGMNLLTAVVGVGIGALGITTLTGFVDLQSTTPVLAIMLGLAVGIDYALFIFTRFRHELLAGRSVAGAVPAAVGTAGSAVLTAGATVVIALVGLAVAGVPFLTEMGVAAAATVVVAVLVALTLVPAVLGLVGVRALPRAARRALSPGGGRHAAAEAPAGPGRRGLFAAWGRTVTSRRWASLGLAVLVLGVVAVPVASMRTSLSTAWPEGSTQARAQEILSDRFGAGVSGPLLVLVDGDGAPERAAGLVTRLQGLDGVALVTPATPNRDGTAALVTVVPTTAPDDEATTDLVHRMRDLVRDDADGAAPAYVTGQTAVSVDVSATLAEALPVYLVLVVGLALVLLVLVFRSIAVPVVGVLGFLLTIGAALGATTAVFQWGWLKDLVHAESTGPLLSLAPIIVVGILFGLAMDYQVFLVSRMHEAHAHGEDPVQAVRTGFRQAAPVVVAAAAIMFAVFAGFVPEGDATIQPIAFALAVGILADAVVVRMVAVPAALSLLGPAAWWLPRWLRWLPTLDVEGTALERTRAG
ncbi:MMPL family transporter [Kineococcus radiotolerans]|uniref:MMPL domain protein n=1 Tax=Kineococcus radiotolerans (strain ATCC BAA-149 / DSM 14245 / SRS30216) TaxID=266940 RepID=A6W605_KINRD|nr:MMPL family transporter [Kineococcus radiotolerans]ABS02244.1 MMPL domain protein [Kineococcus radiotolerans SRS30216 = ATCC BAA-149]